MIRKNFGYIYFKRFLDISAAVFALIIFSPIFALITLFYLFGKNKGPVFYKQKRVGQNGHYFYIYKFRSMIVNAEEKLYANKALYQKFVDNGYKLATKEDPRITTFGAFIRKTSLDELPQFLNILYGDMTIIGPRPVVDKELVEYGNQERVAKLLSVKPGAMGLWQGTGRSEIPYPERADIELEYVDKASIWFDFKVMFLNVKAILVGTGAQ
ncbi:MAG: sugar transferase [Lactobacillaceae bacterium]|jgi:lipopolysaccharide/colanic/teichoic acid biosynthesis glycosyltransferase|nr:sugar transferase [Lactobacillaceae bacterium]